MNTANYMNYYYSISIAKKFVELELITRQESKEIIEKLKKYYKIVDEHEIAIL